MVFVPWGKAKLHGATKPDEKKGNVAKEKEKKNGRRNGARIGILNTCQLENFSREVRAFWLGKPSRDFEGFLEHLKKL